MQFTWDSHLGSNTYWIVQEKKPNGTTQKTCRPIDVDTYCTCFTCTNFTYVNWTKSNLIWDLQTTQAPKQRADVWFMSTLLSANSPPIPELTSIFFAHTIYAHTTQNHLKLCLVCFPTLYVQGGTNIPHISRQCSLVVWYRSRCPLDTLLMESWMSDYHKSHAEVRFNMAAPYCWQAQRDAFGYPIMDTLSWISFFTHAWQECTQHINRQHVVPNCVGLHRICSILMTIK